MNDTNDNNSSRQFDWGPPSSNAAEGFKEWLVYFIILALLGGGVWFLLDINGKDPRTISSVLSKTELSNEKVEAAPVEAVENRKGNFVVQLGAFAEEESARETFAKITAAGYKATLSEPDDQYEIYRISVGPFASENEAEVVSEKLNQLEFSCFVIELP